MKPAGFRRDRTGREETCQSILGRQFKRYGSNCESLVVGPGVSTLDCSRLRELEKRVRDLERLLGRKTMENEILKEAIEVARLKKPTLPQVSWSDREDGSR